MELSEVKRPTKKEQEEAMRSYDALEATLERIQSESPEIEIEETEERIRIPISALRLLAKILKETSRGNPVSIVPIAAEVTTQAAAEYLGCSRPHVVKLLEEGQIPFVKVGKHRRIRFEDLVIFRNQMKARQKKSIQDLMEQGEKDDLYDS
jgi:excisionase family DNA binding protein